MFPSPRTCAAIILTTTITITMVGIAASSSSVERQHLPECFASNTCWEDPWGKLESFSGSLPLNHEDRSGKALNTRADVDAYISAMRDEQKKCRSIFPEPDLGTPLPGVSAEQHLRDFVEANQDALRAALSCIFFPESVEQILEFPEHAIGRHPDYERYLKPYLESARFAECDSTFRLLRANSEDEVFLGKDMQAEVFGRYVESCFEPLSDYHHPARQRIALLGTFSQDLELRIFCMGLIASPELVLTAKHCLVESSEIEDFYRAYSIHERDVAILNVNLPLGSVVITPFASSEIYTNVSIPTQAEVSQNLLFYPNVPEDDFVLLKVAGLGLGLDSFPARAPRKWDALEVFGLIPDPVRIDDAARKGTVELVAELARQVVVDRSPTCYAAYVNNGCIAHQCQTFAGFSGSPVFARRGGVIDLVGVHSAYFNLGENVCEFRRSATIRNRAAVVSELP